jgi:hypothetical protein
MFPDKPPLTAMAPPHHSGYNARQADRKEHLIIQGGRSRIVDKPKFFTQHFEMEVIER